MRFPARAAAAALAFAYSAEFWEQAVIAEVYTLNTFFVVLCLLLLALWRTSHREHYLQAFAVAYGLSLCNHHTMLLLGPVFVAFVLWT
ncbi:MAG: DUF2723 domain-containing protein, partial [Candidatus Competibacteraceae bacterium]|nr:DUF2723 domain-containing protein [Candidatus Competibacteraceae bacterium]